MDDQDTNELLHRHPDRWRLSPGALTEFAQLPDADLHCVGPNGTIFSGGADGNVRQIDASGNVTVFATGFTAARGVAYDAANGSFVHRKPRRRERPEHDRSATRSLEGIRFCFAGIGASRLRRAHGADAARFSGSAARRSEHGFRPSTFSVGRVLATHRLDFGARANSIRPERRDARRARCVCAPRPVAWSSFHRGIFSEPAFRFGAQRARRDDAVSGALAPRESALAESRSRGGASLRARPFSARSVGAFRKWKCIAQHERLERFVRVHRTHRRDDGARTNRRDRRGEARSPHRRGRALRHEHVRRSGHRWNDRRGFPIYRPPTVSRARRVLEGQPRSGTSGPVRVLVEAGAAIEDRSIACRDAERAACMPLDPSTSRGHLRRGRVDGHRRAARLFYVAGARLEKSVFGSTIPRSKLQRASIASTSDAACATTRRAARPARRSQRMPT